MGYQKWTPSFADHNGFLSIDINKRSIKDELPIYGAEVRRAHRLINDYSKKFGVSKFPSYFSKYQSDSDGVEVIDSIKK